MTLFFDRLPVELKLELLKRLPIPYLLYGQTITFKPYSEVFRIFDLDVFKTCDNVSFWKDLYNIKFGPSSDLSINYKEKFLSASNHYIKLAQDKLNYAITQGHINIVKEVRNNYRYIWFNFGQLFIDAVANFQSECVKFIDDTFHLRLSTYQKALDALFAKNLNDVNSDLVHSSLKYVVNGRNLTFPENKYLADGSIQLNNTKFTKKSFDDLKLLKLLLKHKVISDDVKLLMSLIKLMVNENTIEKYLDISQININDSVNYALCRMKIENLKLTTGHIDIFIKKGYTVTSKTLQDSANSTEIFNHFLTIRDQNILKTNGNAV